MELQNYNQDIISTSSSDIPPNYPNTNNLSIPQNKYPDTQFQTQQQYNPPSSQQQYYQSQNIGNPSHLQSQTMMPILPENQYPPNNYVQPITPVFQPPLGADQNISQINHNKITQPQKNMFTILRANYSKFQIFVSLFVSLFFLTLSIIFFITNRNMMVFSIVMTIPSIILIYISFKMLLETNHETDIFLGDNTLTVVKKAIFCR